MQKPQCFCIFCQYVHFRGSAHFPNISRLGPRLPAYFLHIFPISGPAYWELFPNIGLHILPIFVGCPNIFPMVFPIVYQYFPDMSSWCNLLPKRLGKCAAPNIGKILAKYAETPVFLHILPICSFPRVCIFSQYFSARSPPACIFSAYFPNLWAGVLGIVSLYWLTYFTHLCGLPQYFPDVFPIVYQYFPDMSSWCNMLPKRFGKMCSTKYWKNIGKIRRNPSVFAYFANMFISAGLHIFPIFLGSVTTCLHIFPISGPAYWEIIGP